MSCKQRKVTTQQSRLAEDETAGRTKFIEDQPSYGEGMDWAENWINRIWRAIGLLTAQMRGQPPAER